LQIAAKAADAEEAEDEGEGLQVPDASYQEADSSEEEGLFNEMDGLVASEEEAWVRTCRAHRPCSAHRHFPAL